MSKETYMDNDDNLKSTEVYPMDIPDAVIEEWQSIVDLIARIAKVRASPYYEDTKWGNRGVCSQQNQK